MAASRFDAITKAVAADRWPLYFFGLAGRGKSMAAAMVYSQWPEDGEIGPRFWPSGKIIPDLVDARFSGGWSKIRNTVQTASLIVIDDVADRDMTDARRAALLDILNWREPKPLILTGNFNPTELTTVLKDDRLVSRILRGQQREFGGPDLRLLEMKIVTI